MGIAAILGLLGPIFTNLITRIFPDPEKAAKAQIEMQRLLSEAQQEAYKAEAAAMDAKKEIITAEMNQGGWASQWRSYLMLVCISIVAYNWVIASFLNAFLRPLGLPVDVLPVPPELWTLVTVGLGGYLTRETVKTYSSAKVDKAKAENPVPVIDEAALAASLRKSIFKNGMTEEQWTAIQKAAAESVRPE